MQDKNDLKLINKVISFKLFRIDYLQIRLLFNLKIILKFFILLETIIIIYFIFLL